VPLWLAQFCFQTNIQRLAFGIGSEAPRALAGETKGAPPVERCLACEAVGTEENGEVHFVIVDAVCRDV
jgi:hypothetical protein